MIYYDDVSNYSGIGRTNNTQARLLLFYSLDNVLIGAMSVEEIFKMNCLHELLSTCSMIILNVQFIYFMFCTYATIAGTYFITCVIKTENIYF